MPVPTLDTAIGGATANSYRTLVEADAYFEARLDGEGWALETPDRRTLALLKAARRLNQFDWLGSRVTTTQALAWPRVGVPKRDCTGAYTDGGYHLGGVASYGEEYRTDEIPEVVKDAQCELAFAYLNGYAEDGEAEVKSFSDRDMSVTFDDLRGRDELPPEVARLLAGLINPGRLLRG